MTYARPEHGPWNSKWKHNMQTSERFIFRINNFVGEAAAKKAFLG